MIVLVTCVVPWCRRVEYTPLWNAQWNAVEHWQRCHPRRLRASRARGQR